MGEEEGLVVAVDTDVLHGVVIDLTAFDVVVSHADPLVQVELVGALIALVYSPFVVLAVLFGTSVALLVAQVEPFLARHALHGVTQDIGLFIGLATVDLRKTLCFVVGQNKRILALLAKLQLLL